jgi:hypothetical protein
MVRVECLDGLVGKGALLAIDGSLQAIQGEAWCVLGVDVHHGIAHNIKLEDVWPSRDFRVGDLTLRGQTPETQIWFTAARFYHEVMLHSAPHLFQMHDIVAILHCCGAALDWDRVLSVASRYELHPALFYVLHRALDLFDAPVPGDVLSALHPVDSGASRLHDWGDFLPRLLNKCEIPPIEWEP